MRLFLVRHAQSETNVNWEKIVESHQMNSHLTETGKVQARKIAEWLHGKVPHVDALYASSLNRTRETAIPLEEVFGIQAVIDHRIREGGYCYDSGAPIEDHLLPIRKFVNFHQEPYTPFAAFPEGVESYNDIRTRTGYFLTDLLKEHIGHTVIVVTHGWTLNAFIDHIFNVGVYRSAYLNAENTSISYFEYLQSTQREPWQVHFIAQTPHMEVFPEGLVVTEPEA